MTTAAQLIAFLQKLPSDVTVEVLEEHTSGYETTTNYTDLDLPTGDPKNDYTNSCDLSGSTLYLGKR